MAAIEELLRDIDKLWTPTGQEPVTLRIIGSAALMLVDDAHKKVQKKSF